jgi:hypothetical protein
MKTILSVILTATMLSSSVIAAPANQEQTATVTPASYSSADIFARFNVHRQKDGVSVQWTANNIQNISSFIIERSWDGVYFESVNVIEAGQSRNMYLDNYEIYPGYWYYRVTAVMNDGSEISSDVDMVRIVRNG